VHRNSTPPRSLAQLLPPKTPLPLTHHLSHPPALSPHLNSSPLSPHLNSRSGGFVLQQEMQNAAAGHAVAARFNDSVAFGNYGSDCHNIKTCKPPAYLSPAPKTAPFYIPFRALTHQVLFQYIICTCLARAVSFALAPSPARTPVPCTLAYHISILTCLFEHTDQDAGNLLVAGKTMAQSFFYNSASRLHPAEWSSGVAAGAAASLTSPLSTTPPRHHSTTPPLHHSTPPPLHPSTPPPPYDSTNPPLTPSTLHQPTHF
jgi:hypothetical protein